MKGKEVIEKVEAYKAKTIGNALNKAKEEYRDAKEFYNDTGYDRYYNKMIRLEKTIEELEAYIEKDKVNERLLDLKSEKEFNRKKMQEIKKDLLNKLFYLLKVIPECSEARSLEDYIKNLED